MDWIIEILGEFGGGRGQADDIAVRFLLPSAFWTVLIFVAARCWAERSERRDVFVVLASVIGLGREMLMFAMQYGGAKGVVPAVFLHQFYPPIEHTATLLSAVLLGYAFLIYVGYARPPCDRFLWAGVALVATLYVLTAVLWPGFLRAHPSATFGAFWGDMAYRVSASVMLGGIIVALARARWRAETVPWLLFCAFAFLFLDEFLMIINLATAEAWRGLFAPIRHNLHIWAVLLFVLAYGALMDHALRQNERRLRRAEALAHLGNWTANLQTGVVECSPELLRIFGIDARRAPRVKIDDFARRIPPQDWRALCAVFRRSLDARDEHFQIEHRVNREPGPYAIVLNTGKVLRTVNGEPRGFSGIVQDISARKRAEADLWAARIEIIERLALAAEYRSAETGRHLTRMSLYAEAVALRLGHSEAWARLVRQAAPMHDVGKIGIPDRILLKAGPLDDEEFAIIKRHPLIGSEMLAGDDSEPIRTARIIALTHHEWWDGSGYPEGLAGESIPLEGRVAAVADVYDALTMNRTYKAAWSEADAAAHIERQSGRHFDPSVVNAFRTALPELSRIRAAHPEPEATERPIGLAVATS